VPKAKKYTLNLYFLGNRIWSAASETPRLEYAGETPLKQGAMYLWEVTATIDGKAATICEGAFHTASERQRTDADALKKLLAKPEVPYLAVAAMWYQQNGLITEAIAVHKQLAKLGNDPAVYGALADIYWRAGRDEEARAAEEKAAELEKKVEGGGRKAETK
jgi:tetratricopeptide (TPR) repeat protein